MASFQHRAPDPGITEIRVHGVGGTSPVAMLGRSDLVQVAGDEISGFYRSTETESGRTVEAYSWGGLTTSSASRALWVLLLPFSLVNIAGWMIEPARKRQAVSAGSGVFARLDAVVARWGRRLPATTSPRLERVQRWLVHVLALAFTATYVQLTAYVAVDLFANQCGGSRNCLQRLPLNVIFGGDAEVGRRLVIGMAAPIALLVLFLFLARRSRLTYESYRPSDGERGPTGEELSPLEDPLVWDRVGYQTTMAQLHAIACLGVLLLTFSGTALQLWGEQGGVVSMVHRLGQGAGAALAAGALVLVGWTASRSRVEDRSWKRTTRTGFWVGWLFLVVVLATTWGLTTEETLDTVNWFGLSPLALLTFAIGLGFALAACQALRWVAEGYLHTDQFLVVPAALIVALYPRPAVLAGVAVILLLINVAAPAKPGSRTAIWDMGLLTVLAAVGWAAGEVLDEQAYLWAGVAVASVAAAFLWLARRPEPGFRWVAVGSVGAFAAIMLLGIFSGVIVRTAAWLSDDTLTVVYPGFYQWAVVAVTLTLLVVTLALALYGLRTLMVSGGSWRTEAESRLEQAGYPPQSKQALTTRTVFIRAVVETAKSVDVMITLAGTVLFAAGLAGFIKIIQRRRRFSTWFDRPFPEDFSWLLDLAGWLAVGAVVGAYLMVRSGLRSEATRRKIGMVWDVASFFPRTFHPLAPPAYAARAVPEIQARVREAVAGGGRVILAGHSQGSVIAAAVIASLPEEIAKSTALVTYGSPLGKFYRAYFPDAVPDEMIQRLARKVGPGRDPGDLLYWVNFYRRTDPIGDRAFREGDLSALNLPDGLIETLAGQGRAPDGGDVELDDPWETQVMPYRPLPKLRVHSGYESDPAWIGCLKRLSTLL
jgi:hypothetical protein